MKCHACGSELLKVSPWKLVELYKAKIKKEERELKRLKRKKK